MKDATFKGFFSYSYKYENEQLENVVPISIATTISLLGMVFLKTAIIFDDLLSDSN